MNIALLGPPGSGKGTLARALATRLNLAVFDSGATLRAWADAHDPALAAHLAAGGMAPTELVIRLMGERLATPPAGTMGWVIDGFPRNKEQAAQALQERKGGAFPWDGLVVLRASEAVIQQRLNGRVLCTSCGQSWHPTFVPSPQPGLCSCGGRLAPRRDDTASGIAQRLRLYREETEPGIARIAASGAVPTMTVSADTPDPEAVWQPVLAWIEERRVGLRRAPAAPKEQGGHGAEGTDPAVPRGRRRA